MSIRRSPSALRKNFTVLSNATLADTRLSWEARGLLAYLISKPDHWVINVKHLVKESPSASTQRIHRILKELEGYGYLTQERSRDDKGRLGEMERIVHEIAPETDFTTSGFSTRGESTNGFSTSGKAPDIVRTDLLVRTEEVVRPEDYSDTPSDEAVASYDHDEPCSEILTPNQAEAARLCVVLASLMTDNGVRPPKISKEWERDMEHILRLDQRSPEEVEFIIRWSQQHDFWKSNILSPKKLRKQFDRLRLQAESDYRKRAPKAVDGINDFLNSLGGN